MLKNKQAAGQPCLRPCMAEIPLENFPLNRTLYFAFAYRSWMICSIRGGSPRASRIFHNVCRSTESYAFVISKKAKNRFRKYSNAFKVFFKTLF